MRRSLHLGLLVAALATGCGKEEDTPENLCKEHDGVGCSEGRTCEYDSNMDVFRCVGKYTGGNGGSNGGEGESGGSSSGNDSRCGGSPLNGMYLLNVGNCESGAITPGDPGTCTFQFRGDSGDVFLLSYSGMNVGNYVLIRQFTSQQVAPYDHSTCTHGVSDPSDLPSVEQALRCAISADGGIYALLDNETRQLCLTDNRVHLTGSPFKGREECIRSEKEEEWHQRCYPNDGFH